MKTIQDIKKESENKLSILFEECHVFFAFSDSQFMEGREKHPLKDGEKYVSIGHGGYCINTYVKNFIDSMDEINKSEKKAIKELRDGKEKHILYELSNYECFYTGDIDDAVRATGYLKKDVQKVYLKYKEKYQCF